MIDINFARKTPKKKVEFIFLGSIFVICLLHLAFNFFQGIPKVEATNYQMVLSDWSGGADPVAVAVLPTNQNDWNKFYSENNVSATTSIALNENPAVLTDEVSIVSSWDNREALNPSMVEGNTAGEWYVVYESYEYNADYLNIAYRKSIDNGVTWSSRVDITTNIDRECQNSVIAIDSSGNLHIVYESYEYNESFTNIAYRKSIDGGNTWSDREDLTTSDSISLGSSDITVDNLNNLHVVYYFYVGEGKSAYRNIGYRKSTDGGINWSAQVEVSTGNSYASAPKIAVDSSNTLHVVYFSKEYNSIYNIAYRTSTDFGITWSGRTDLTTMAVNAAYSPQITIDNTDNLHVVYYSKEYNATYDNIAYRKSTDGGLIWSAKVDVTTSTSRNSTDPYINTDNSGNLHVAYESREYNSLCDNVAYKKSTDDGVTWSARQDLTTISTFSSYNTVRKPKIIIDQSSNLNIIYDSVEYENILSNISYLKSTDGGSSWADRVSVTTAGDRGFGYDMFDLVLDLEHNLYAFYVADESTDPDISYVTFRKSVDSGVTWSDPSFIAVVDGSNMSQFKVIVDSSDNLHLVYVSKEYNSSYYNIAYRNSTNGGTTWSDRADVTTSTSRNSYLPEITIDSLNNLHIVYFSREFNATYSNIAYRKSTNGGTVWSDKVDLTTSTSRHSLNPRIIADDSDNIHVAFYSKLYNATYDNIAYRRSTNSGISWDDRVDVTTNTTASSLDPEFVVDSSNNLHIVYQSKEYDSGAYNLAHRKSTDGGVSWGARNDITTNIDYDCWDHKTIIDSLGRIHVVYYTDNPDYDYYYNITHNESVDGGDTWSTSDQITSSATIDSSYPQIYLDNSNNLNVLYEYYSDDYYLGFKKYTPSYYDSSGELISSKYDTSLDNNTIDQITWLENLVLPDNTSLTVSIRTANSSDALDSSAWVDFSSSSSTCVKSTSAVTCSSSAIPSTFQDYEGDRWVQHRFVLTSTDGLNSPTVDNFALDYGLPNTSTKDPVPGAYLSTGGSAVTLVPKEIKIATNTLYNDVSPSTTINIVPAENLEVNNTDNSNTSEALESIAGESVVSSLSTSTTYTNPYDSYAPEMTRYLVFGSKGWEVRLLQSVLRYEGFFTYPENTGYLGPITTESVRNFQAKYDLPTPGVVGPLTRSIINKLIGVE